MSSPSPDSTTTPLPPHLALAAHWLDTLLATAPSTLHDLQTQTTQTLTQTHALSTTATRLESTYSQTSQTLSTEHQLLADSLATSSTQLDTLAQLTDELENTLKLLEESVGSAESAVGLSLGGRLGELSSRLFAGSRPKGVPYLRQWAPKHQAVPEIPKVNSYFTSTNTD